MRRERAGSVVMMQAPRGPLRVLWVVKVVMKPAQALAASARNRLCVELRHGPLSGIAALANEFK